MKTMVGKTFNQLTIIARSDPKRKTGRTMWLCQCTCGNKLEAEGYKIRSGHTKSCGCRLGKNLYKHGQYKTKIYTIWQAMKSRCFSKNGANYKNYGGRGIGVCDEWLNFEGFKKDMGDSYKENLELDRIDNNGKYCKENCRWTTRKVQCNNTRVNAMVNYYGKKMTVSELADHLGVSYGVFYNHYRKHKSLYK